MTALARCKCGGRTHDGCWQGRVSSQTQCILAVRERGQGPELTLFSGHTWLAQTGGYMAAVGLAAPPPALTAGTCNALLSLEHRTDTLHKCKETEKSFILS